MGTLCFANRINEQLLILSDFFRHLTLLLLMTGYDKHINHQKYYLMI